MKEVAQEAENLVARISPHEWRIAVMLKQGKCETLILFK